MTKLMQQLNFSSSNYYDHYEASTIEPAPAVKENFYGDGASLSAAGSKRSALSASDAECFSLCLGAGPLWLESGVFDIVCLVSGGPDVPVGAGPPPGGAAGGAARPASSLSPSITNDHHDDNRDLLSALLWASASSLSGSSESLDTHPVLHHQQTDAVISKILERKDRQPVKVEFKIYLTENTVTRWEAVVQGGTIYLRLPGVLQSGSKESFMLLLDFAEERLRCSNCIICVLKSRPDRATLLRTFMFMGFSLLPPNSPLTPAELNNPDYIFLHYNMQ